MTLSQENNKIIQCSNTLATPENVENLDQVLWSTPDQLKIGQFITRQDQLFISVIQLLLYMYNLCLIAGYHIFASKS